MNSNCVMKVFLISLLVILFTFSIYPIAAQSSGRHQTERYGSVHPLVNDGGPSYSLGIVGNYLRNPGINLRYEHPLLIRQREVPKRRARALYLNGNLGFYWDPYTHVATYLTAGIMYRRTYKGNFQTTLGINPLGVQRNFFHETYSVNDALEVERESLAGRTYYAPELIVGIGRIRGNRARFLNLHIMILSKYNTAILPTFNWEFGYRF